MTTLLAKKLTLGIKSEVDNLSEIFKKMAVINEKNEEVQKVQLKERISIEMQTGNKPKTSRLEIDVVAAFSGRKNGASKLSNKTQ